MSCNGANLMFLEKMDNNIQIAFALLDNKNLNEGL